MRIGAVVFCYNEEHILRETLAHYGKQGVDLFILDNGSTDGSVRIASESPFVKDVVQVDTKGYEWQKLLKAAEDYIHEFLDGYDWLMLVDADSFYHSPVVGWTLAQFLAEVRRRGFNCVNGTVYNFHPTDADDPAVEAHVERLRHYDPDWAFADVPQEKMFAYHPTLRIVQSGHCVERDDKRLANVDFVYKHYPWVSFEHGVRKIFEQRLPRYVEKAGNADIHCHYDGMRPVREDLVLPAARLKVYAGDGLLQSYPDEDRRRVSLVGPVRTKTPPRMVHFLMNNRCNAACSFCNQVFDGPPMEITLESFKTMVGHLAVKEMREFVFSGGGEPLLNRHLVPVIEHVNRELPWVGVGIITNGILLGKLAGPLSSLKIAYIRVSIHGTASTNDRLLGRKVTDSIMEGVRALSGSIRIEFHCALSAQNVDDAAGLVRMASEAGVKKVCFWLCRYHPHMAEADARDSLFRHRRRHEDAVASVEALPFVRRLGAGTLSSEHCHVEGDRAYHRGDLGSAVRLWREGARLGSDQCRKNLEWIRSTGHDAGWRSGEVEVDFERLDPGFFKSLPNRCRLPWEMMVVDADGSCYPCCGGEVHFRDGGLDFGNLLRQDLAETLNGDAYVRVRRTCLGAVDGRTSPKCLDCHFRRAVP